ncbi:MAG: flagellar motor protein MotB [Rhodospirillales bacterium]
MTKVPGTGAPWLITFVDMISLLLTFMVAIYASADISDPVWQPAAAALRAAFAETPASSSSSATIGEPAPLPGLRPGYLAHVLGERLQQIPLFASLPPVYDDAALRLTLSASAVFTADAVDVEPIAAGEFGRFAAAVAPVANAVAVLIPPDPTAAGVAETSAADDWEGAIGRALALGRVLAEGGLDRSRLSLLAGGGTPGDGIRVVVEAEGRRR